MVCHFGRVDGAWISNDAKYITCLVSMAEYSCLEFHFDLRQERRGRRGERGGVRAREGCIHTNAFETKHGLERVYYGTMHPR